MTIQNRDTFLDKLAQRMGRPRQTKADPMPSPVNNYAATRLTEFTQAERCQAFMDFAKVMMVYVAEATEAGAAAKILELCEKYGGGELVINNDERLTALGITQAVQNRYSTHIWTPEAAGDNLTQAEKANIGIVYAEYGLTETGGIVLFSEKDRGRAVSLLPEKSIVVVRKSTVLPRVAQLAQVLHEKAQNGERMPSCINIIAGPSSTADIELIKVVGVHGPVAKIYLVIDDL